MIQILEEDQKTFFNPRNPFCAEAEILFFDSIYKTSIHTNPELVIGAQYYLSNSLLKAGKEQKAIDLLEKILPEVNNSNGEQIHVILANLGLANVRLAERPELHK